MKLCNISIQRISQEAFKTLPIEIFVNDAKVLEIRDGETRGIPVAEGAYSVYAKIGWSKSEVVSMNLRAGERKKLEVGSPAVKDSKHLIPILVIISLIVTIICKYLDNDLLFWIFFAIHVMILSVYFYKTVIKANHLYLKETTQTVV